MRNSSSASVHLVVGRRGLRRRLGGCCWPAGDLSPALCRPCRSLQMFFSASSGASSSVSGLYSSGRNLVVGQCVIVSHRHFLCRRPAGTLSSGRQGFDFGQKPDAIFLEYVIFCVGRLTRVLFFLVPTPRCQQYLYH